MDAEFIQKIISLIYFRESFCNPPGRHMYRACLFIGIEIDAGEAFEIAVEDDSHQFSCLVHRGAAGFASTDIAGTHKIERRHFVQTIPRR